MVHEINAYRDMKKNGENLKKKVLTNSIIISAIKNYHEMKIISLDSPCLIPG